MTLPDARDRWRHCRLCSRVTKQVWVETPKGRRSYQDSQLRYAGSYKSILRDIRGYSARLAGRAIELGVSIEPSAYESFEAFAESRRCATSEDRP